MTALRDLLARCEKAAGPDRELDLAIAMATRTGSFSRSATFEHLADVMRREDQDGGLYEDSETGLTCVRTRFIEVPPVTSSIDAAVALVERLQPGRGIQIVKHRLSNAWRNDVCIWHPDETDEASGAFEATSASAPLALVCALLKSLIAGEEKGRG